MECFLSRRKLPRLSELSPERPTAHAARLRKRNGRRWWESRRAAEASNDQTVTPSESEGPGRRGGAMIPTRGDHRPSRPLADARGDSHVNRLSSNPHEHWQFLRSEARDHRLHRVAGAD